MMSLITVGWDIHRGGVEVELLENDIVHLHYSDRSPGKLAFLFCHMVHRRDIRACVEALSFQQRRMEFFAGDILLLEESKIGEP